MKKTIIILASSILLVAFGKSSIQIKENIQTKKSEIMTSENRLQIENLLAEYQKALVNSDAKLAQSLYTKDGIFMPTEAPSGVGKEEILKSYEFVFSQIQLEIVFEIKEIEIEGDMAFAVTNSEGTVHILANGVKAPESNRELFVFKKVSGEWKIARYMFNKTSAK